MKNIVLLVILLTAGILIAGCASENVKLVKVAGNSEDVSGTADVQNTSVQAEQPQEQQDEKIPAQQGTAKKTKADLKISNFFLSALNVKQNEEFEAKFKIENAGSDAISGFEYSIKIMKGNNVVKSTFFNYTKVLGVGETTDRIIKIYSIADKGTFDVIVKLDPLNAFEEPNETNNEDSQKINVIAGNITSASSSSQSSSSSSGADSTSSSGCVDSDGGKDYEVKGTCRDGVSYLTDFPDFCISDTQIIELYCSSNKCQQDQHTCVCKEGICVS